MAVVPNFIGTPNTANEGSYKARSFYNNSNNAGLYRSMLISPVFDLSSLNRPVLIYWHTQVEKGSLRWVVKKMIFYKKIFVLF